MNTTSQGQELNTAFKRFQRLPELPSASREREASLEPAQNKISAVDEKDAAKLEKANAD